MLWRHCDAVAAALVKNWNGLLRNFVRFDLLRGCLFTAWVFLFVCGFVLVCRVKIRHTNMKPHTQENPHSEQTHNAANQTI